MDARAIPDNRIRYTVMAWPLLGQWDRETTPPGASVADLPTICAALCKAINQRRKYSFYFEGAASGSEASFTYAQGLSKEYPTAADFSPTVGTRNALNGSIVRGLLSQMKSAIEDMVDGFNSRFWTDSNFTARWEPETLWAAASVGLDAWDISAPVTKADNWLILKNALNLLRYIKPQLAGLPTGTSEAHAANDADFSTVIGFPTPTTVSVADVINCGTQYLIGGRTPGVEISCKSFAQKSIRCLTATKTWTCPAFVGTALHTPYTAVVPDVSPVEGFLIGGGNISGSRTYSATGSVAPSASLSITVNYEPNPTGDFLLVAGFGESTDANTPTSLQQNAQMGYFQSSKPGYESPDTLHIYVDLASFLEDQS